MTIRNLNREHLILMHAIIQKNENQTSRSNIKLPHESTILDLKVLLKWT